jgi:uncharacterized protein YutE (UPF0331/DUF86 family)
MTSFNVIENKISSTRKYLSILERYEKYSKEEVENNIDIRGAVERYLYLVVQSTIDLAESIISYRKLRKPITMAESFHILYEKQLIPLELMQKLVQMTGFRNAIAHAYDDLDYSIVFDVLHNGKNDIVTFLNTMEKYISLEASEE